MSDRAVINFAAGPAKLPTAVLNEAARDMLDYAGTGIGVMVRPPAALHSHRWARSPPLPAL